MHVPVIARECMSGQRKYVIGMHSTHALHASYAVPILVDAIDSRLPSGRVAEWLAYDTFLSSHPSIFSIACINDTPIDYK